MINAYLDFSLIVLPIYFDITSNYKEIKHVQIFVLLGTLYDNKGFIDLRN